MDNRLLFTIIEAIYLVYMYNYFKTSVSFHNPVETLLNDKVFNNFFKHPIYSGNYESKICRFGNLVGFLLAIWVILRYYISKNFLDRKALVEKINKLIFCIVLLGAIFLNFNAFIYYLPIFLYELFI